MEYDTELAPPYKLKIGDKNLEFQEFETSDPVVTPAQVIDLLDAKPAIEHDVYFFQSDGDFERLSADSQVDLRALGIEHFIVFRTDRSYKLTIDGEPVSWGVGLISGKAVRKIGNLPDGNLLFLERRDEPDQLVADRDLIDLDQSGVEKFYSRAPAWKLRIRQNEYTFPTPVIRVREALAVAGFDLQKGWDVVFITASGRNNVQLDDQIDLSEPGVERLRVKPTNVNNGEALASSKRDFSVLENDESFLNSLGLIWETVDESKKRWLIIRGYQLPEGFDATVVDLALEIPSKYPSTEINMFYLHPAIARSDGKAIEKTNVLQLVEQKNYQRWSRHRHGETQWNPAFDCVETHLELVEECLCREVGR